MIQRNGKISGALGLEELMLLKCPYYPKQSIDLHKRPQIPKAILRKNRAEVSCPLTSDYTTKLQSSIQYGTGRKTDTDQCNRIDSPEINPYNYSQLIYDKGGKKIQ